MRTPNLKKVFESVFHGQVYTLNGIGYDVPKLTYYAQENYPVEDIVLDQLIMSKSDEKHGSKEFIDHAKKVNVKKFPIVTVALNDGGIQIADGNHRAWKAKMGGNETIAGYVIPEDEMPAEAIVDVDQEYEEPVED